MLRRLIKKLIPHAQARCQNYHYREKDNRLSFAEQAARLTDKLKGEHTVTTGWPNITYASAENQALLGALTAIDERIKQENFRVEKNAYENYLQQINYKKKYPRYYNFNFIEKTLEHYIAFTLLNLQEGEKFVDIAAEHSPHSKEFSRLARCTGYSQDIMFKPGIHGEKIGSDAAALPVPDGFFQAALAACSIEHFENTADILFMQEMSRVLSPGGRILILPLYLHKTAFCAVDPRFALPAQVEFDAGIDIRLVKEFNNRHGRFYSPQTLYDRLLAPNLDSINFTIYYIENFRDIDPTVYCRFALLGQKQ